MDLVNISASIRVDDGTRMGSVIDVIRLVNPNLSSSNAGHTLTKLGIDTGIRYDQLRINGKGKLTPVADARTLVEIVWSLPGKAARDFRRSSAQTVCRVLGGDLSLVQEIEARHHTLQQSEGGKALQDFLVEDEQQPSPKRIKGDLPVELQIATLEQKRTYIDMYLQEKQQTMDERMQERQLQLQRQKEEYAIEKRQRQVAFVEAGYNVLAHIGVSDARDKIMCSDLVRRVLQENTDTEIYSSDTTLVLAKAVPADDVTVPTPECDPVLRGGEISMHTVASNLKVRIPRGKEGQVGKAMKGLYAAKYGVNAASRIPKFNVPFNGQVYPENTYWQRDVELMEHAVRSVV
jgi:hypothetical protein